MFLTALIFVYWTKEKAVIPTKAHYILMDAVIPMMSAMRIIAAQQAKHGTEQIAEDAILTPQEAIGSAQTHTQEELRVATAEAHATQAQAEEYHLYIIAGQWKDASHTTQTPW
jgi:hypothetical protein